MLIAELDMSGIFITGTDTNVGKTVVSAAVALALDADYWKPVQAGADPATDRERVAAYTGYSEDRLPAETYCLREAASPHLAAAAEGIEIDLDRIRLPRTPNPLIVEGAGGVMVPLTMRYNMLDLMERLALPVLLVSRTELGTINHTLLSLAALRQRKLQVLGVLFNGEPAPAPVDTIRRLGQVAILGRMPVLPEITPDSLRAVLREHLDLSPLRAAIAHQAAS